MKLRKIIFSLGCLLLILPSAGIHALNPDVDTASFRKDAVKLYLDCERCDMNYIRREVPYVNYVREVKEAQLYVLMTRQRAGNGGDEYTFSFEGQMDFTGMNDTLSFTSMPDDTRDHVRSKQLQILKMGLMKYVAKTPLSGEIDITHSEDLVEQEVVDRWNNWVFELSIHPFFEGEETYKELSLYNSVQASKITEDWKFELEFDHHYNRVSYTYEDTSYTAFRNAEMADILLVKSLGEHWSAGMEFMVRSSTFSNYRFQTDIIPSIEYNIFPYSESTRRQLRMLYGIGYSHNIYNDSTIYKKIQEGLFLHNFKMAYEVRQKWGSIDIGMEAYNYLHDFSKNRIELGGRVRVRIARGLSISVGGSVARVRDQISLKKGDLSQAEVLLRLQEVATGYYYHGMVGISYTFGSIYNNIVNPRFGRY